MKEDPQFSLAYSEQLSDEQYSVYTILIFPTQEQSTPQTVVLLPVDRETLDINLVNVWGDIMPIGARASTSINDEDEEGILPESIRDAIVPRILIILSMTITGYNFLDPQAQKASELEEKLDVPEDDLPEAPSFDFDSPEDLFKAIDE